MNITVLQGELRGEPQHRALPSGDVVVSCDVAVPADGARPAETVPVAWSSPPTGAADALAPGERVVVVGRVRRRFFRVGGATQSRTEVVAEAIVPVRHGARATKAVAAAAALLAAFRAR